MANIKKILGQVENAWPGQGDSRKAVLQIKKIEIKEKKRERKIKNEKKRDQKKKRERNRKSEKEREGKNKEKD